MLKTLNGVFFAFSVSFILLIFVACSDDKSGNKVVGGATESTNAQDTLFVYDTLTVYDTIVKPVTNDTNQIAEIEVKGVVQKGPFVQGSAVTVLELNDKLQQTGRAFRGKTDSKGFFTVSSVELESPYAILEATGFYLNEVTGAKSNSMISLYALVDFSEQKSANVNIASHIEYDRVDYLVHEKGLSIVEAKKQADAELAKVFHVDSIDATSASIFGESGADGVLLATSILVAGERSDAEISELLAELAEDFREDGELNDTAVLSDLADYAEVADFEKIRKNILSWKIAETVAPFEKFVEKAKEGAFGLGSCTNENKGEIKVNQNKKSAYANVQFRCNGEHWKDIYYNPNVEYGTFKDDRDGYEYRTVKIGDATWFAENLRYRTKESVCFDGNESNCKKYGALYTYDAAQGACPEGSHVSSIEDWRTMLEVVGGSETAGPKLRARGAWNAQNYPQTWDDTDEFGLSFMPSGVYVFGGFGDTGWFATSTRLTGLNDQGEIVEIEGIYDVGVGGGESVNEGNARLTTAIAIRCVLD